MSRSRIQQIGIVVLTCLSGALGLPGAARAAVDEVVISALYEDRDGNGAAWYLEVEVEGSGLISGSIEIFGEQARVEDLSGDSSSLDYVDPPTPPGFATFSDLADRNPPGTYVVTITDEQGTKSATLDWNPTVPVGSGGDNPFLQTTFPEASTTLGCGTPDVRYTLDCANCTSFIADVADRPTGGGLVAYEYSQSGQPFPAPVSYAELEDESMNPAAPLEDGGYEIELAAGNENETTEDFDTGSSDPFDYFEEAAVVVITPFDVANAQQDVDEILIGAIREEQDGGGLGWEFDIEIEAWNVCSVQVDIPGPMARSVRLLGDSPTEFDLDLGPYATFQSLQEENGPGTYSFLVNEAYTVDLVWDPVEPVGATGQPSVVLDSPADGEADVSSTPDVDYTLDCTNCAELEANFFDVGDRDCYFDQSSPFDDPILFSSFQEEGGSCAPLGDGAWEVEILAGILSDTPRTLTASGQPNDPFDYIEEASVLALAEITVPEPSGSAALIAVLLGLAPMARRRTRAARSAGRH